VTCSLGAVILLNVTKDSACVGVIGCVTTQGAEDGWGCAYEWPGFRRMSKILFGNMVLFSFRWLLVVYSAYMWNRSYVHI
jgi:hypothetical protein